jgi:hypothetical protein
LDGKTEGDVGCGSAPQGRLAAMPREGGWALRKVLCDMHGGGAIEANHKVTPRLPGLAYLRAVLQKGSAAPPRADGDDSMKLKGGDIQGGAIDSAAGAGRGVQFLGGVDPRRVLTVAWTGGESVENRILVFRMERVDGRLYTRWTSRERALPAGIVNAQAETIVAGGGDGGSTR